MPDKESTTEKEKKNNRSDAKKQQGKDENDQHDQEGHNGHENHDHTEHHRQMAEDFKRRFWITLILTIPVVALAPLIQNILGIKEALSFAGDKYVQFGLSTIIFIYGGYPFLKGLVSELKEKMPGMMTLISLAIIVAYVYSSAVVFGVPGKTFFWELATLIVVMLLGHWIEMKSVIGASSALEELAKLLPSEAHKKTEDGSLKDVPINELEKEDHVVVKPGEKIPADGKIVEGESSINEAMVTGESKPVSKGKGDEVIGGAINGESSITVEVGKVGEDSYISRITNMVKSAQQSKSKSQRLADRAAFWLTLIAITAGIVTMVIWLGIYSREFVFALERTVTVMVITCPHALGLAIPLVVAVTTAISAKNGLLIRNRTPFEKARNIDAVILDKTGTLTKGEFKVTKTITINSDKSEKEILQTAASVETQSEHVIAKAIVNASEETDNVENFEAIPGKGARGKVNGKKVMVVSPGYLKEHNIEYENEDVDNMLTEGQTVVFLLIEDDLVGAIGLDDPIREESKKAINILKEMNIKPLMLTGDNKNVAERVAAKIGIEDYFAEVLPDNKADKVNEVKSDGYTVAMVGDGVNDAPALANADVGIAIGAGTDVAAETADIVLVKNNPLDVVKAIKYSKASYRKMLQNLAWATGYNVIAIPLAAGALASLGILLNPAIGALVMSLSTVIVAINARLLKAPEVSGE